MIQNYNDGFNQSKNLTLNTQTLEEDIFTTKASSTLSDYKTGLSHSKNKPFEPEPPETEINITLKRN